MNINYGKFQKIQIHLFILHHCQMHKTQLKMSKQMHKSNPIPTIKHLPTNLLKYTVCSSIRFIVQLIHKLIRMSFIPIIRFSPAINEVLVETNVNFKEFLFHVVHIGCALIILVLFRVDEQSVLDHPLV